MKNLLLTVTVVMLLSLSHHSAAQSTNGNGTSTGRENWLPNRGNVGIGTRSPSEALEVLGNVRVSQTVFTNDLETIGLKAHTLNVEQDAFIGRHLIVSGNVGIGISNPSERLHISGNLKVSNSIFGDKLFITQFTTTDGTVNNTLNISQKLFVNGVTGLGVASPAERLEVSGNAKVTQGIFSDFLNTGEGSFSRNLSVNQNLFVSGNSGFGVSSPSEKLEVSGNVKVTGGLFSNSINSGDGNFSRNVRGNQNIIADGSIGVGVENPAEKLEVVGNAKISRSLFAQNINAIAGAFSGNLNVDQNTIVNGLVGIGVASPSEKLDVLGNIKSSADVIAINIRGDKGFFNGLESNGNLTISGNVGIGVTTPVERLEVGGNIKATGDLLGVNVRADKGYFSSLESNGTLTINGNVGIGVSSPSEKLEVAGNIKASQSLIANSASIAQDVSAGRNLTVMGNVGIGLQPGSDNLTVGGSAYVNGLLTADNLTVNQKLDIKGTFSLSGNLGIGVISPESALHVNGDGQFDGNIRANKIIVNAIEIAGATQGEGQSVSLGDNLFVNGAVGIGTTKTSGYKLSVDGKIRAADDIKVYSSGEWSDFVFEKDYSLRSLADVEKFIKENGHLPEIPSASQVKKDGIDLAAMDAKLLQKIEELTLYMIELKKENEALREEITSSRNSKKNR